MLPSQAALHVVQPEFASGMVETKSMVLALRFERFVFVNSFAISDDSKLNLEFQLFSDFTCFSK